MNEREVVNTALDNLKKNTGIVGIVRDYYDKKVDGELELVFKNKRHFFPVVVKKEVRPFHLAQLTYKQQKLKKQVMLVAEHIVPAAKEELRELGIPYLEVNGNVHLKLKDNLFWVELGKTPKVREGKNRAFTPTGLQVVFQFLLDPKLINLTQRELADIVRVGLGQINNVFNGLKTEGFLVQKNKNKLVLRRREELFQKWIVAYEQRLKPKIKIGDFRFVKPVDFDHWDKIKLDRNQTFWGGEPAGNILTDYLYPQKLTIYTDENRKDLIKNYKMIPDEKGNIEVFKKFWYIKMPNQKIVPPALVYADLINNADKRCRETAQMIYERQIADRLVEG